MHGGIEFILFVPDSGVAEGAMNCLDAEMGNAHGS